MRGAAVEVVFVFMPQPFHPGSPPSHEAMAAVEKQTRQRDQREFAAEQAVPRAYPGLKGGVDQGQQTANGMLAGEEHGSSLKVATLQPGMLAFARQLFSDNNLVKDASVWEKGRSQVYGELAEVAQAALNGGALGSENFSRDTFLADVTLITANGARNDGNAMTPRMKQSIRHGRELSMHVTPTVRVNGIAQPDISSSWSVDDWFEYLSPWVN
jgi:hypothetical protein